MMRKLSFLLIITYLTACNNASNNNTQLYNLKGAKDAYDYPILNNKTDTDIYIYQLKGILPRRDSLLYVKYGSTYLKQFDEENLSLRAFPIETFRFSYCPFGQEPINITFDSNEMIVKIGVLGVLYPVDTTRKFKYKTKVIKLSNTQYNSILDLLKKSNFDNIPWKIESREKITDGGGYTFEANTKSKFKYFVCYGLPIDTLLMTNFCKYLLQVAKVDNEIKL
jgi:hypothetical protein